jgi:16S rRNA (uracil1498-N3)-methyltransferase
LGRSSSTPLNSLPRFFVDSSQITGVYVDIPGEDAHKISNVLRLRVDEEIVVLDNTGARYHCRLTALAKGDKVEQVIRQNTEAGASAFWLMNTDRCIVQIEEKKCDQRVARYQKVAREAAEQSNRAKVPEVNGILRLKQALAASEGSLKLFCYESEQTLTLKQSLQNAQPDQAITLFIGPEGGFTNEEVELAKKSGAITISLGSRVLRTETAGLVAISQVLYALEG